MRRAEELRSQRAVFAAILGAVTLGLLAWPLAGTVLFPDGPSSKVLAIAKAQQKELQVEAASGALAEVEDLALAEAATEVVSEEKSEGGGGAGEVSESWAEVAAEGASDPSASPESLAVSIWGEGGYASRTQDCPGLPESIDLKRGAPPKPVRETIEIQLLNASEGRVLYREMLQELSCVFITQECAVPEAPHGQRLMGKLGLSADDEQGVEDYRRRVANLPSFTEGSLGTCAIVGNSDKMLKKKDGAAIDAHDTVFRHNTPIKGYEQHVGRKSSIVYVKNNYKKGGKSGLDKSQSVGMGDAELAYALLMDLGKVDPSFTVDGTPVFLRGGGAIPLARMRRDLYRALNAPRGKHASGGFARPMNLLASRLCTRVDLYGFSDDGGGKYFNKEKKVQSAHLMPFELWSYRYLQSQGKLCVY